MDSIRRMRGAAVYRSGRLMIVLHQGTEWSAKWCGIAYLDGRVILESRFRGLSRDEVLMRTELAAVRAREAS